MSAGGPWEMYDAANCYKGKKCLEWCVELCMRRVFTPKCGAVQGCQDVDSLTILIRTPRTEWAKRKTQKKERKKERKERKER